MVMVVIIVIISRLAMPNASQSLQDEKEASLVDTPSGIRMSMIHDRVYDY